MIAKRAPVGEGEGTGPTLGPRTTGRDDEPAGIDLGRPRNTFPRRVLGPGKLGEGGTVGGANYPLALGTTQGVCLSTSCRRTTLPQAESEYIGAQVYGWGGRNPAVQRR